MSWIRPRLACSHPADWKVESGDFLSPLSLPFLSSPPPQHLVQCSCHMWKFFVSEGDWLVSICKGSCSPQRMAGVDEVFFFFFLFCPFGVILRLKEISRGPVRRPQTRVRQRRYVCRVWSPWRTSLWQSRPEVARSVWWGMRCGLHMLLESSQYSTSGPHRFLSILSREPVLHPVKGIQLFSFLRSEHLEKGVLFQTEACFFSCLPRREVCSHILTIE